MSESIDDPRYATILDLEKIKNDKALPAVIRDLAKQMQDKTYLQSGEWIKNLNPFDFAVFSSIVQGSMRIAKLSPEECIKEYQQETTDAMLNKLAGLVALMLGAAEGTPGINEDNIATFTPNLHILYIVEDFLRKAPQFRDKLDISKYGITDDLSPLIQAFKEL